MTSPAPDSTNFLIARLFHADAAGNGRFSEPAAGMAEEENRKLKKLLAESMLDVSTLKEMLGKNF